MTISTRPWWRPAAAPLRLRAPRLVGLLAGAALLLSACGVATGAPSTHSAGATSGASPSSATPGSAGTTSPTPTATCARLTGRQALATWGPQVPRHPNDYEWDLGQADPADYDPCAPLSWIVLPIIGPTGSSPYAIMLFHHGTYVGPATKDVIGFAPATRRVSPSQLSVTYTYEKPGEITAGASGRATALFTWDAASGKVVRTGQIPPGYSESAPGGEQAADAGEDDGDGEVSAGGTRRSVPAGSTKITSIRPATTYSPEVAVIVTPSKNIGCDLSSRGAGCGVQSYIQSGIGGAGRDSGDAQWWFELDGPGVPSPLTRGDAPWFASPDVPAQVVGFGRTVHYRNYVCSSAKDGLTCWNTETGHGVKMARAGYEAF